jgi:hypothetical protein
MANSSHCLLQLYIAAINNHILQATSNDEKRGEKREQEERKEK